VTLWPLKCNRCKHVECRTLTWGEQNGWLCAFDEFIIEGKDRAIIVFMSSLKLLNLAQNSAHKINLG